MDNKSNKPKYLKHAVILFFTLNLFKKYLWHQCEQHHYNHVIDLHWKSLVETQTCSALVSNYAKDFTRDCCQDMTELIKE